uniref:Flagellar attachment zone protein 1 conserved domain-containing protein n=1 Tax=Trypanosoma rangeli TaxID=5698 RepID=R9TK79_TRYRA|nr:hypothetical protein [Trypanosoma rangeli]
MTAKTELTMELDDFVCFERVGADLEWKNTIGKVIGFPTPSRVRVEFFDRSEHTPHSSALMDEKLQEMATQTGRLALWEKKLELDHELQQALEEEDRASEKLFAMRESTQQHQAKASNYTRETMMALDATRDAITRVPQRQWREMRAPGRPTDSLVSLGRAIMLVLQEDPVKSWEAMQDVMRQPDFMDRVMGVDCSVTPLPKACRKKIMKEIGACRPDLRGSSIGGVSAHRERSQQSQRRVEVKNGTQLEAAVVDWLLAQVTCSDAREAEERIVDELFEEHQEQARLLQEVNSMRENISAIQEKLLEKKLAICGGTPLATLLLKDAAASHDSVFYKRMANGRAVTELLLRSSVLLVLGAKAEEHEENDDSAVFVRLTPEEIAQLRDAVRLANDVHDLEELEALYPLSEREEEDIRELQASMEELRCKDDFTEQDEEEMRQLDAALTHAVRHHEMTQWRIRQLEVQGRDRLFLENRRAKDMVHSELHLTFSGDAWGTLLDSAEHRAQMEAALCKDLSRALGLPTENMSNFGFTAAPLRVTFTVRHGRDVTAGQLQALAEEADFEEFLRYYESVTAERSYPLNTLSQRLAYEEVVRRARLAENFAGAGLREKLEDFADDSEEGETDDENYRRPKVEIATVRSEYGPEARYGYPILQHLGVPAGFETLLEASRSQGTEQAEAQGAAEAAVKAHGDAQHELDVDEHASKDYVEEALNVDEHASKDYVEEALNVDEHASKDYVEEALNVDEHAPKDYVEEALNGDVLEPAAVRVNDR